MRFLLFIIWITAMKCVEIYTPPHKDLVFASARSAVCPVLAMCCFLVAKEAVFWTEEPSTVLDEEGVGMMDRVRRPPEVLHHRLFVWRVGQGQMTTGGAAEEVQAAAEVVLVAEVAPTILDERERKDSTEDV